MRKHICLIVSLVPLFVAAQITGRVHLDAQDFFFEKQDGYDRIIHDGGYTSEVGAPELPVLVQSWVIPANARLEGITVTTGNRTKLASEYLPYPVQEPVPVSRLASPEPTGPDTAYYCSSSAYPDFKVRLLGDGVVMGYHVVTVEVAPFEYLPATRELYLSDIIYTVGYTSLPSASASGEKPRQSLLRHRMNKAHVASMVENPEDMEACAPDYAVVKGCLSANGAAGQSGGFVAQVRGTSVQEELVPNYIIITNEALKPVFQRLADWKTRKGLCTVIVTVEEITGRYRGSDTPEKIRNYLLEAREKWGDGLFVLLGGDTNVVPAKIVMGYKDFLRPSDHYYYSNSIRWDAATNRFIKDSDRDFFFYWGRASVENASEADIFIDKVLKYERASADIDHSYVNNYLAADAFLDITSSGRLIFGAMHDIDSIFDTNIGNHVQRWYQFDHFNCELPDHDSLSFRKDCGEELNRANFLSALTTGGNSGLNHFHFVYHMDHSSPIGMGASSKDKGQCINNDDAIRMGNGDYLSVVMSGGCETADFSKDCVAERFLNAPDVGAVAFIGNSDVGWSDEWTEFGYFMEYLFGNASGRFGHSIALPFQYAFKGSWKPYWRYHLLGDPEMPVWTNTPQNLDVSVSAVRDTAAAVTSYGISVQVNNLPAGEEALVCVMKGTEYYAVELTEGTQPLLFTIAPRTSGEVYVTVTANNFRPYEVTVPVDAGTDPRLSMEPGFRDSGTGCNGNGDGRLDAGETVELVARLSSPVARSLTDVTWELTCNAPEVEILEGSVSMDSVSFVPDTCREVRFLFRIGKDCGDRRKNDLNPVRFELYMQSDGGGRYYQDGFHADIFAPDLEVGNQQVVATSGGSPGTDAGKTVLFSVELTNVGAASAVGLTGTLVMGGSAGSILSGTSAFPDLLPGETRGSTGNFSFRVPDDYVQGMSLPLTLHVGNRYDRSWDFGIDPLSRPDTLATQALSFTGHADAVELFWPVDMSLHYNVYRSATEGEQYVRRNTYPLAAGYFKDEGLAPFTTYYYKVTAVNAVGNEALPALPVKTWTICPSLDMFPLMTSMNNGVNLRSRSSVAVYDMDFDGRQELFSTQTDWEVDLSRIIALGADGRELFETDGDLTQYNGFGPVSDDYRLTPLLADLRADGDVQLVVAPCAGGHVRCYSLLETEDDRSPRLLWAIPTDAAYTGGGVGNVDGSSDGSLEVVFQATKDGDRGITVFNADGQKLYNFGAGTLQARCQPAIADLDGDGDMEIIAGGVDGLYIWHHNGTPFSRTGNPVYQESGYFLSSSPVVADLDGDGQKEIIVVAKKDIGADTGFSECFLLVLKPDGTLAEGWNRTQQTSTNFPKKSVNVAVGDVTGDGKLEVVVVGANHLRIWDCEGVLRLDKTVGAACKGVMEPIIADVDGDNQPDILFAPEDEKPASIFAFHPDGTEVAGFPIPLEHSLYAPVTVADINADGKNELLATGANGIYAWKTPGNASCVEWGSGRGNGYRTGEYGSYCLPMVVTQDTVWDNDLPCGSVIVCSGNFQIPSGKDLFLDSKARIVVREGATLTVDGGSISNASVWIQEGGRLLIRNNGIIRLRSTGCFTIAAGAVFDYQQGGILPANQ